MSHEVLDTAVNPENPVRKDQAEQIVQNATGTIATQVAQLTSGLAQEVVDRQTGDTAIQTALTFKADLVNGTVPSTQLPSFVDDVLEFINLAAFPTIGESGKVYIAIDTNKTYRWSGSVYVIIGTDLALGETASTAYRGDRGKIAYDHSQITSGNPHNVTKTDIGLSNADNTSDVNKPVSTAQQTAINLRQKKVIYVNGTPTNINAPIVEDGQIAVDTSQTPNLMYRGVLSTLTYVQIGSVATSSVNFTKTEAQILALTPASYTGQLFMANDTGIVYKSTGTAWVNVNSVTIPSQPDGSQLGVINATTGQITSVTSDGTAFGYVVGAIPNQPVANTATESYFSIGVGGNNPVANLTTSDYLAVKDDGSANPNPLVWQRLDGSGYSLPIVIPVTGAVVPNGTALTASKLTFSAGEYVLVCKTGTVNSVLYSQYEILQIQQGFTSATSDIKSYTANWKKIDVNTLKGLVCYVEYPLFPISGVTLDSTIFTPLPKVFYTWDALTTSATYLKLIKQHVPSLIEPNTQIKNYLSDTNFEDGGFDGWGIGQVSSMNGQYPVTGATLNLTPSSPPLTLANTAGNTLGGNNYLKLTSTGAVGAGYCMYSKLFTVLGDDTSKTLTLQFAALIQTMGSLSMTTMQSTNSFVLVMYCSDGTYLPLTNAFALGGPTLTRQDVITTWVNGKTTAGLTYRLLLLVCNAIGSTPFTIAFRNFLLNYQTAQVNIGLVSDTQIVTLVNNAGGSYTAANYKWEIQRRGDRAFFKLSVEATNTNTASSLIANLPLGLQIDTSKLGVDISTVTNNSPPTWFLGNGGMSIAQNISYLPSICVGYQSPTQVRLWQVPFSYSQAVDIPANGIGGGSAPSIYNVAFEVPITGWSSGSNLLGIGGDDFGLYPPLAVNNILLGGSGSGIVDNSIAANSGVSFTGNFYRYRVQFPKVYPKNMSIKVTITNMTNSADSFTSYIKSDRFGFDIYVYRTDLAGGGWGNALYINYRAEPELTSGLNASFGGSGSGGTSDLYRTINGVNNNGDNSNGLTGYAVGSVTMSGLYPSVMPVAGTSSFSLAQSNLSDGITPCIQVTSTGAVAAGQAILMPVIQNIPNAWKGIPLAFQVQFEDLNGNLVKGGTTSDSLQVVFWCTKTDGTNAILPLNYSNFILTSGICRGQLQLPMNVSTVWANVVCTNAISSAVKFNLASWSIQSLSLYSGGNYAIGQVIAHSSKTSPAGFLYCNGQAVSRSQYSQLFAAISTTYGSGDGSTTFNVPDLRGRFLRGLNDGSGNDPDVSSRTALNSGGNTGDNIGSYQGDQFGNHAHSLNGSMNLGNTAGTAGGYPAGGSNGVTASANAGSTAASGGSETRPKNVNVAYHICYQGLQMSSQVPIGAVNFKVGGNLTGSAVNNNPVPLNIVDYDTMNGYNLSTYKYTIPYSDYYLLIGKILYQSTGVSAGGSGTIVGINTQPPGGSVTSFGGLEAGLHANGFWGSQVSGVKYLTQGTTVWLTTGSNGGTGNFVGGVEDNCLSITRIGSNQVIATEPTVKGQYRSTNSATSLGTLIFNVVDSNCLDNFNLYNTSTGEVTYDRNSTMEFDMAFMTGGLAAGSSGVITAWVNGVASNIYRETYTATAERLRFNLNGIKISGPQGTKVKFVCSVNSTIYPDYNYFSFKRIGNAN